MLESTIRGGMLGQMQTVMEVVRNKSIDAAAKHIEA